MLAFGSFAFSPNQANVVVFDVYQMKIKTTYKSPTPKTLTTRTLHPIRVTKAFGFSFLIPIDSVVYPSACHLCGALFMLISHRPDRLNTGASGKPHVGALATIL